MQTLTKIADLKQPQEAIDFHHRMATQLGTLYIDHVDACRGGYNYEVEVGKEGGRAKGVHASEVSKCFRQLVYAVRGDERKSAATTMKRRFRLGHAVHAMIQSDWHRIADNTQGSPEEIEFEDEVRIHPGLGGYAEEWDIHSSCDGIITLHQNNEEYLRVGLEIKTESQGQFEKLRSPRAEHLEQACIYMACLDLPLLWFLYYNKSNSNITPSVAPFLVRFNPSLWENLELRFARAHAMAEAGKLPERDQGIYCAWCSFSWHCKPKILTKGQPAWLKSNSKVGV